MNPESERLVSVAHYLIMARQHDPGLTTLTRVATTLLEAPIAWIALVGETSQYLLAATGALPPPGEFGRSHSFCGETIRHGDQPLLVGDARSDPRFQQSPLVLGSLAIRSYAGATLRGREGLPIGALCVLGREPRRFGHSDAALLLQLAPVAEAILEARRARGDGQQGWPLDGPGEAIVTSPVWRCAADGLIRGIGNAASRTMALPVDIRSGLPWTDIVHPLQRDQLGQRWRQATARRASFVEEFRNCDGEEAVSWLEVQLQPQEDGPGAPPADGDGSPPLWWGSFRLVDHLRTETSALRDPATTDMLTGLANRSRFQTLLDRAVHDAGLGIPFALLCLDLDEFKLVNDTLGHDSGDRVLRIVGERLGRSVRRGDVVGRLGGDEFLVIQTGINLEADAASLGQRIINLLREPIPIDGHLIEIGVSIGIALGPRDGADGAVLQRHADFALYRAKQDGRGVSRFFDPNMDALAMQERDLRRDLRHALERGEFRLAFQPIVSLRAGEVACFEALLRWTHPDRGAVPPAEFIPIAESTGLIVSIGAWVLHQACLTATTWPSHVRISVNLSPRQFNGDDVVALVARVLAETGLAPGRLELEITETLPLLDNDRNLEILRRLREMGVRMTLDDFGVGYSSLAYLGSFRFDAIKLDRKFVSNMSQRKGLSIARAIIGLAVDLDISVTAEGIETAKQLRQVAGQGCSQAQGYWIARPMPPDRIPAAFPAIGARLRSARPSATPPGGVDDGA